jgi:phosphoribosyl 1,2-cyclic phosphodiesterase
MTHITLQGTGGGRFATIFQERATGGVYVQDGLRLHIDPGPGALVQMKRARLDPTKTDAILVSHCHPDHYTDAEILVEAMTGGAHVKRGLLAGSTSVLEGAAGFGPAVSAYHKSKVETVRALVPGDTIEQGPMTITATPASHSDPTAVGFRIGTSAGEVGYVPDTALAAPVVEANRGVRVLIVPLTRPLRARIDFHLCTEDAAELVAGVAPEMALLTHFGLKILREDPEVQAQYIEKKTGVRTVVGEDLMTVSIAERVLVRPHAPHRGGGRHRGGGGGGGGGGGAGRYRPPTGLPAPPRDVDPNGGPKGAQA